MQGKVNHSLIGLFVVGAVALLVIAVLVFGRIRWGEESTEFVLFFEGSVKGLNTGAPVVMKGVPLGSVTNVSLRVDWDTLQVRTEVLIEISAGPSVTQVGNSFKGRDKAEVLKQLVGRGLRAQLALQSFVTGQQMISLDFYPDDGPPRLVGARPEYLELPTTTSGIAKMAKSLEQIPLEEIATDLRSTAQGIEALINSEQTKDTLASVNKTMKELAGLSERLNAKAAPVLDDLDGLIKDAWKLVQDVDKQVEPLGKAVEDLDELLKDGRKLAQNVDKQVEPLATDVRGAAQAATDSLRTAEELLAGFQGLRSRDAALAHEIATTLQAISGAMNSVKELADYLERHPEALLSGK